MKQKGTSCLVNFIKGVFFLFLLCLGAYVLSALPWYWQYYSPPWFFYREGTVYFEYSKGNRLYRARWNKEDGIILSASRGDHILYAVPPGYGRAYGRFAPYPGYPLRNFYSYARGYVDTLPHLPGEGRIRWTPDGQFLVTSVYIFVPDKVRVWRPAGSRLVLATKDCHVQIVMVEGKGWRLWDPDLSVRGLLAYARGPWDDDAAPREIVVRDFRHGKAWVIGEGVNPTWSPDGEWLAYTGYDGLYVARWDGSQKRRVLPCTTQESMEDIWGWEGPAIWWKWPPRPDWSPDGKWLIYHRREGEGYNIYKLNVATGEEELLIRDGVHPQWRWKRQAVAYPEDWGLAGP